MTPAGYSPRQVRILDLTGILLLLALLGFGMLYQIKGWKLEGTHLIGVCVVIVNYVNLFRAQLSRASARIDELEKRLPIAPAT
jgi:hypothetical protein